MAEFLVVDVNAERRLLVLLDREGRYHVACATAGTPPIRSYVRGFHPERGFALLVEVRSGQVHRIIFEVVDCNQERALAMLHESAPAVTSPAVPFRATRTRDPWDQLAPERRADRSGG